MQQTIKNLIIEYYENCGRTIDSSKVSIYKVKSYKYGYLALTMYSGEGPEMMLLYITKDNDNNYKISKKAYGEYPISMGYSINILHDSNNTILFGGLNETTWVPSTDKRIPTDFQNIRVTFSNEKTYEEKIMSDEGYIIVVTDPKVINITLYNSKGEITSSSNDLGCSIRQSKFEN